MKKKTILFFSLFLISTGAIYSKSKKASTPAKPKYVSGEELVNNPGKAVGETVRVAGTVTHVLYKGNSIRFVVHFSGKPVVLDSDDYSLMNRVSVGSYVEVCGFYLKNKKLDLDGRRTDMPSIVIEQTYCSN
ncbi:transporter [Leptospira hartskeerlii]|uniref:Transporter n=1 Tax=Leptospira hartskeerlii TaxID=2023177 RepID=A0A2M9XBI9_9LEPT|nr:TOBE domain-containing protein [Leptospira hartskeerlii]PJZ25053.1 transporter [Leptospira hartskeerlii]PJZ33446.1 transporter [Leptospira hartskeerlii]